MTPDDLAILETLADAVRATPGVRTVRLARPGQRVEVPLSGLPAVVLRPGQIEPLTWPEVPVGRYHLLHWEAAVLDRAVPETRAFKALLDLAQACREAMTADALLGGKTSDGPASQRRADLAPAVGAVRLGPPTVETPEPGRPTAVRFAGAAGYWAESMTGQAAFDGELLFGSGPHVVVPESPVRRLKDLPFNGLAGGLTLDLGQAPRRIRQRGVLSASTDTDLALLVAACEAFIDGCTYTLTAPDGTTYPHCRMAAFERLGPAQAGAWWHQPYRIIYEQLAR